MDKTSGRSGLLTFVPLIPVQHHVWSRDELRKSLRGRGFNDEPYYPYVTSEFILDDWDFDEEHWDYWKSSSGEDAEFWGHLFARVLDQPKGYWSKAISAKALQVATTGTKRTITHEDLLPSWIVEFRSLPCLRDTRGHYRQPAELLRRTPETESLLDVEPFVRAEDDNEHTRPLLIKLGVRDTPTGPDRLLDRLRDLARGYARDGSDRFYHPDGSWIQKTAGNSFPWERYSASGELQQCYWTRDHCIEREPLQVEADVWELCDKHPDKYTLLLTDPTGEPVELPGRLLRELRDSGRLTIYLAKYCLVYNN